MSKSAHNLLNKIRKRKLTVPTEKDTAISQQSTSKKSEEKAEINEDWLTKKALEEIERTASFHKVKRETFGSGMSAPKAKTNKKFLATTLSHALSHNQREQNLTIAKSNSKLKELDRYQTLKNSTKKFGDRKHEFRKPEKKKDEDDR